MKAKIKEAAGLTATPTNNRQNRPYPQEHILSIENHRTERIRKHRADIPKIHRKAYDQAMQGRSLKSAIKSFCLQCVQWQKEEIRHCTSLACPLYPYRPYKQRAKQASEERGFYAESQNEGKGV